MENILNSAYSAPHNQFFSFGDLEYDLFYSAKGIAGQELERYCPV
jgi:hypothetical protein